MLCRTQRAARATAWLPNTRLEISASRFGTSSTNWLNENWPHDKLVNSHRGGKDIEEMKQGNKESTPANAVVDQ